MQGHTDIPLNEEGREQAKALNTFFASNQVDLVFASDLGRAIESAAIATQKPQEHIIRHAGFKEASLGNLEGLREDEIIAQHGPELLENWRSLEPHHRHFSVPGGESREQCNQRLLSALLEICQNYQFQAAAICSHGFAMRRLFHHISGESITPPLIANCVIYQLEFDEKQNKFLYSPHNPK